MKVSTVIAFLLALTVGACEPGLDRDHARVCRMAILALNLDGDIHIKHQASRPGAGSGPPSIHIDYTLADPTDRHFAECEFGGGVRHVELTTLRTEAGMLPEPRLYMLNRFWLHSNDVIVRDPLPVAGSDTAPRLPFDFGYALQQIVNAIPAAAVYGLLAAAYSLIYGLVGRINLAFGAFAAIGGATTLIVILGAGSWNMGVALVCAGLAAMVCTLGHGLVTSRLVFQPLHGASGQQGLVATIGLSLFLGEYLRLAQGNEPRWIGPILNTPMALAKDSSFVVTVTPIAALVSLIAGCAATGLVFAMAYSRFGREWRAFSDDPKAAALFGIGRNRIFAQTFALASALAGLSGYITIVSFGDFSFAYATTLGLKALTAAVLGGIGSVPGALLGGLFIGLVESGWSASFPIVYRDLAVFLVLIATLIWRPGGFFGFATLLPRRV